MKWYKKSPPFYRKASHWFCQTTGNPLDYLNTTFLNTFDLHLVFCGWDGNRTH
ncbi:hypothetical protein OAO52_04885 [Flavobacteriaceae bacterium]|nr:hypothetical protein [Flavobacteriaceae bacterium]